MLVKLRTLKLAGFKKNASHNRGRYGHDWEGETIGSAGCISIAYMRVRFSFLIPDPPRLRSKTLER
jgi:hypothetical protein